VASLGISESAWGVSAIDLVPRFAAGVVVVLVAWAAVSQRWRVVLAGAAPLLTIAFVGLVKTLVDRRDVWGNLQFPSGHVAGTASLATLIVVTVVPAVRRWWIRVIAVGISVLASALMLMSVIGGKLHWAIDAVAGLPTGIAVTLGWCWLIDTVGDRIDQLRRVNSGASGPGPPG
jgi:membrane-associated phospholipid phosphatase